jgi:type VI secretion system protein ImpM
MDCYGQAPGFFGKLPSHGDFVGRRLPPQVRQCLDDWLQRVLVHSKAELGPAWLATWGSSPLWRFVIGAGVCGEQAWAGVMMPSADRVGRCFPLLLGAGIDGTPSLRDCLTLHDGWFARIEELALSALEEACSLDGLDAALLAAGSGLPRAAALGRTPWRRAAAPAVAALDGMPLPALADEALDGGSAWWTGGAPGLSPCLAVCAGLPAPAAFAAMLDGDWHARGWSDTR